MRGPSKTRRGARSHEPPADDVFSSPPCFMHDVDPAYFGFLTRDELLDRLNALLEGERAGARSAARLMNEVDGQSAQSALRRFATDAARFCALLAGHIRELGGMPSLATGVFDDALIARSGFAQRLAFFNRGQGWIARKLRDVLPGVRDDRLHDDLKAMLAIHEASIRRCDRLLETGRFPLRPQEASRA